MGTAPYTKDIIRAPWAGGRRAWMGGGKGWGSGIEPWIWAEEGNRLKTQHTYSWG